MLKVLALILTFSLINSSAFAVMNINPGQLVKRPSRSLVTPINALSDALKNPKYRSATNKLGPTVIDLSTLPYTSPVLDSGKKPWSSWWYPKIDLDFTQPKDKSRKMGILEKFDLVNGTLGTSESAYAYETNVTQSTVSWEGLCDAWAIASLVYPEPRREVSYSVRRPGSTANETVTFDILDLKGLLLKTFESSPENQFDIYGEKYLGNSNGWIFPDIFPDQFHRLIEVYLGERKQAFMMDHDARIEVWSVPVYKASFKITAVEGQPNTVMVKMWLITAAPAESDNKEVVGTVQRTFDYTYTLSGDLDPSGRYLTINDGDWVGESINKHPDYFLIPKKEHVLRKSFNPFINIQKVDEILVNAI